MSVLEIINQTLDEKIKERDEDLQRSVKAGMPTGMLYSEINLLEELKTELSNKLKKYQENESIINLDHPDIDMYEFRHWFDKSYFEPLLKAYQKNPLNRFNDKYEVIWDFRADPDNKQYAVKIELYDWSKHPEDPHLEKMIKDLQAEGKIK